MIPNQASNHSNPGERRRQLYHVPLIEPTDDTLLREAIDAVQELIPEPACPVCSEWDTIKEEIGKLTSAVEDASKLRRSVERMMHDLQQSDRATLNQGIAIYKMLGTIDRNHLRCALCRIAIGTGHIVTTAHIEPFGHRGVCASCYDFLNARQTTVESVRGSEYEN